MTHVCPSKQLKTQTKKDTRNNILSSNRNYERASLQIYLLKGVNKHKYTRGRRRWSCDPNQMYFNLNRLNSSGTVYLFDNKRFMNLL